MDQPRRVVARFGKRRHVRYGSPWTCKRRGCVEVSFEQSDEVLADTCSALSYHCAAHTATGYHGSVTFDQLVGPLLLLGFFAAFFAVTVPLVYALNVHVIGPSYDRKAAELFTRTSATERVLYEEDDVAMILRSRAVLAVGIQYRRAHVRITERALYVAQQGKFLGRRMGQPILAVGLAPIGLDPAILHLVFVMYVAGQPKVEGRAISLPLTSRSQAHTLVLEPKGAGAIEAIEAVMYPR